ncbi:MAG: terpene cyclase/mutase family protein [Pirellulales bacterium]|nr:terpene cyclase/mutase family protein [Pirellulales bacterium]
MSVVSGAPSSNPSGGKPVAAKRPVPQPPPIPLGMLNGNDAEAENQQNEEDLEQALLRAPPWLVSTVVHMLALILLGVSYYTVERKTEVEITATSDATGSELVDEPVGFLDGDNQPLASPNANSEGFQAVELPLSVSANPFAQPTLNAFASNSSNTSGLKIGDGFRGRGKGMKGVMGRRFGITADVKEAIKRALEWFKRNQRGDGAWSLKGPYADGGYEEDLPAATGMALLAFQGDGHTHREGEYKAVVKKGWDALLKLQSPKGQFMGAGLVSQHQLYAHAQCTIAICELYGMSHDSAYLRPAQLAVDYCVFAQDKGLGGWRYEPQSDSDLSVTGWFLMALQSARMAGLEVPPEVLEKASKFLDAVQVAEGSQYTYIPRDRPSMAMTAEGLLSRQYLGWKRDDIRLVNGANQIVANPITMDGSERDAYYWYYATQVMHHMEGDHWRQWNRVMSVEVPRAQIKDGRESGSWNPGVYRWGDQGGRLFITALQTYMLEVYYRHMPIYGNVR